jgi:hypothetical protein
MTDEQLVAAFESAELPAAEFSHSAHVRVAWWYLRRHPFAEARTRLSAALQRFAAANGAHDKYHETITVAYLVVIAERLAVDGDGAWDSFVARNPDLFERRPSILERYYSAELLGSERAKREFVRPDRGEMLQVVGLVSGS